MTRCEAAQALILLNMPGRAARMPVTKVGANVHVSGPEGVDNLVGIERIQFSDSVTGPVGNVPSVDFNGDGKSDLVWQNTNGAISVWAMNGATLMSDRVHGPYSGWSMIESRTDFNGDGRTDLVWQEHQRGCQRLDHEVARPCWATTFMGRMPGGALFEARGDFNGDGKSDLVWQNTSGAISVWTMMAQCY